MILIFKIKNLKTITLNSAVRLIRSQRLVLSFALLSSVASFAQLQNNGTLFISDNGFVTLKTGDYIFGTNVNGVLTKTTRTNSSYGKLVFGSSATSSGASNAHYIDGYARTLSTQPFILNLGQSNVLAPIRLDAVDALNSAVDAAFYNAGQTKGAALDPLLANISNTEYWNILGSDAKISLSWRVATLSNLQTSDYTIVGYNSGTSRWDIIPSSIDPTSFLGTLSTPISGSITSTNDVNLQTYQYFTIGAKGDACQPLVAASGPVKTWTGSAWILNGGTTTTPPDQTNPVIINGIYSGESFTCNSLVLNANVNLGEE